MSDLNRLLQLSGISEDKIRKQDPELDDYYADVDAKEQERKTAEKRAADAPYVVGSDGQYWEWYGDDEGNGRYKAKGGHTKVYGYNIPTYELAMKVRDQVEKDLDSKRDLENDDNEKIDLPYSYVEGEQSFIMSKQDFIEKLCYGFEDYYKDKVKGAKDYSNVQQESHMNEVSDMLRLAGIKESSLDEYEVDTWFERDRGHVCLSKNGKTIIEWWDDDLRQAIDDGFLNPKNFRGSAIQYAHHLGLL